MYNTYKLAFAIGKDYNKKQVRLMYLCFGMIFFVLEMIKQCLLIHVGYNIWYFPFQLCSMPIYLNLFYAFTHKPKCLPTWLVDYGLLGGIAALIVHSGFTDTPYLYITIHGYLWHSLMILEALLILYKGDFHFKAYGHAVMLLLLLASIAEVINIMAHPYGDCDMFYISPYHLSSQPIFSHIDQLIGRPLGIIFYLLCMMAAGGILHLLGGLYNAHRRQKLHV